MILNKTINVHREDTDCNNLSLNAFRNDEGEDGILLTAWHKVEVCYLIQTDFIKMDFEHIHSFLRDYSSVSATDYVDRFVP